MRSMSSETGHSVLIHIHQPTMVTNQLCSKYVHKMYDHRHLLVSMPQRDSSNNIMIAYVIAILLLQRDDMIKISTSPTTPTVTPELINRLGSRWNTMLKRLIGNEKEFKPALDSMLDEMLIFVKTSGIETIQHKRDYLQNKRAPDGKNLFELIKDFFPHLGIKYSPDQILIQLGMMIQKMLGHSVLGLPIEDKYHIGYKRYDAPGALCADIFSKLLKQFLKSVRNKFQKHSNIPTDDDIKQIILSTSSTKTNKLRFNFATREWLYQQGVSQVMEPHIAQWSYISLMRKIVLQVGKD